MKTTNKNIKKLVLIGLLIPILGTITGCSSNEKENNNKNTNEQQVVEKPINSEFEKMTSEESANLQNGDIIEKEADRAVLEKKGLDYVYVYNVEIHGEKYEPTVFYDYMGKEYLEKTTNDNKVINTFDHLEVVEIYYEKDIKTNKIMKKMKHGIDILQVDPIYPELAKEKVKTK